MHPLLKYKGYSIVIMLGMYSVPTRQIVSHSTTVVKKKKTQHHIYLYPWDSDSSDKVYWWRSVRYYSQELIFGPAYETVDYKERER